MKKYTRAVTAAVLLLTGAGLVLTMKHMHRPEPQGIEHLNCILDIAAIQDTTRSLLTGYHYNLLRKYAAADGKTVDIRLSDLDMYPMDSLSAGSADLVVMPLSDAAMTDSTICSIAIDSSVIWVMRYEDEASMVAANIWLGNHLGSPSDSSDRERFFHPLGHRHRGREGFVSPYDSLMKVHADSLGWDWRMLAALIYVESRFHIEARSYRGAEGLLQLMPATARRFGSDDSLDPEQSIMTGTRYLASLSRRYQKVGGSDKERFKYTIAAYNAGEGRISDCIRYARYRGVDPSLWDNIEKLIPEMRNDSINRSDVVSLGTFQGYETIAYVEKAMRVYDRICKACPE